MVYGSGAELAIELLRAEVPEVVDGVRPKMENIVPGERVPLLDHHRFGSEESQLYGCAQSTGASADDQALRGKETIQWNMLVQKRRSLVRCHGILVVR